VEAPPVRSNATLFVMLSFCSCELSLPRQLMPRTRIGSSSVCLGSVQRHSFNCAHQPETIPLHSLRGGQCAIRRQRYGGMSLPPLLRTCAVEDVYHYIGLKPDSYQLFVQHDNEDKSMLLSKRPLASQCCSICWATRTSNRIMETNHCGITAVIEVRL